MDKINYLIRVVALWSGLSACGASALETSGPITACFTPGDDCRAVIVREIDRASRSLTVQAYSFTEPSIIDAILRAQSRAVTIAVALDRRALTERGGGANRILSAGIPLAIDATPKIAHNKVMVIDSATVITGSFNFTRAAARDNAENVVIIRDPAIARAYAGNFSRRWQQSRRVLNRASVIEQQRAKPIDPVDNAVAP